MTIKIIKFLSSKERSANSAARSSPWATAWWFGPSLVTGTHPIASQASQIAQKVGSRISPSPDCWMKPCHNFSTCPKTVGWLVDNVSMAAGILDSIEEMWEIQNLQQMWCHFRNKSKTAQWMQLHKWSLKTSCFYDLFYFKLIINGFSLPAGAKWLNSKSMNVR